MTVAIPAKRRDPPTIAEINTFGDAMFESRSEKGPDLTDSKGGLNAKVTLI